MGVLEKIGVVEATTHTPVYMMHKYWARRPWKVFRRLVEVFTRPGEIVLDPFAGGGVCLVEGLIKRRRVIAIDLNPLATFIMEHEAKLLDVPKFRRAVAVLRSRLGPFMAELYKVRCPACGNDAVSLWAEYEEGRDTPIRIKVKCGCGFVGLKQPEEGDLPPPSAEPTWVPDAEIPPGDKTRDLLRRGIRRFSELFTKRNLIALSRLREEVMSWPDPEIRSFLMLAFSSTLKWASKMSHLRRSGKNYIVEGWAMHAYWIYPRWLEINVWEKFLHRARTVERGKTYTNRHVGDYARRARRLDELLDGRATYMVIQGDASAVLEDFPDECVDAVITDPPYGGNVNYAELSDYFLVWLDGRLSPKDEEIIVNKTRGKDLRAYEEGLHRVFRECFRVLKSGRYCVSTFNSKDMRVVGAFIVALRRAGFAYVGTSYQPYLRGYTTTFHAMQIDAMPFDFVFVFRKDGDENRTVEDPPRGFRDMAAFLREELEKCKENMLTERDFRARTYPSVIEFLARASVSQARLLATHYEKLVASEKAYFAEVRRRKMEQRRKAYLSRRKKLPDFFS